MYWNYREDLPDYPRGWLIETWDVLKSPSSTDSVLKSPWLIETWDVLKYRYGERNV